MSETISQEGRNGNSVEANFLFIHSLVYDAGLVAGVLGGKQ